jgi:hypothetical protein
MTTAANNTKSPEAAQSEIDPRALFAWWESLSTPYTKDTQFEDWDAEIHKDAACFTRYPGADEGFLVREGTVMHFGFDYDTVESAYEALPPRPILIDSASIIRRWRAQN